MGDETRKHLFVFGYDDRASAEAAVNELTELGHDQFLQLKDYAIVSKDESGNLTVSESKDADAGGRRGAVAGGMGGLLVAALAGPIGLGAVAVGAGVGAVTAAVRDSGFKGKDLDEVGRLMRDGRTILIVAVRPEDTERLHGALDDIPEFSSADRWEADIDASSKNVLGDAIEQYKKQHDEVDP
jgi:uncharacterized membrane protein